MLPEGDAGRAARRPARPRRRPAGAEALGGAARLPDGRGRLAAGPAVRPGRQPGPGDRPVALGAARGADDGGRRARAAHPPVPAVRDADPVDHGRYPRADRQPAATRGPTGPATAGSGTATGSATRRSAPADRARCPRAPGTPAPGPTGRPATSARRGRRRRSDRASGTPPPARPSCGWRWTSRRRSSGPGRRRPTGTGSDEWMLGTTGPGHGQRRPRGRRRDPAGTGIGPLAVVDTMEITGWDPPHGAYVRHLGRLVRGTAAFEVRANARAARRSSGPRTSTCRSAPSAGSASGCCARASAAACALSLRRFAAWVPGSVGRRRLASRSVDDMVSRRARRRASQGARGAERAWSPDSGHRDRRGRAAALRLGRRDRDLPRPTTTTSGACR